MEVCIPDDFDPEKIMDSGQCFRAVRLEDGSFRFLTGDQAACKAACEAFADTVCKVAAQPDII